MTTDPIPVVTEVLVDVARRSATITYGELVAELGRRDPELGETATADLASILRTVSTGEDDAGRGLLTAVVVRENSGLPGGGFFRLASERGRGEIETEGDRGVVWRAELARVYQVHSALG